MFLGRYWGLVPDQTSTNVSHKPALREEFLIRLGEFSSSPDLSLPLSLPFEVFKIKDVFALSLGAVLFT